MQSLGVISINLWQVLISLANLGILFLLVKKFLFQPVRKILAQRQAHVDQLYAEADEAKAKAEADQGLWAERMAGARAEADSLIADAREAARRTGDILLDEAKSRADGIVRQAEEEAELEKRRAEEEVRREMADLSTSLAGKLLGREISAEDHKALIDSFLDELDQQKGAL